MKGLLHRGHIAADIIRSACHLDPQSAPFTVTTSELGELQELAEREGTEVELGTKLNELLERYRSVSGHWVIRPCIKLMDPL